MYTQILCYCILKVWSLFFHSGVLLCCRLLSKVRQWKLLLHKHKEHTHLNKYVMTLWCVDYNGHILPSSFIKLLLSLKKHVKVYVHFSDKQWKGDCQNLMRPQFDRQVLINIANCSFVLWSCVNYAVFSFMFEYLYQLNRNVYKGSQWFHCIWSNALWCRRHTQRISN